MNNKKDRYFSILDQGNMFQDSGHRTRFKELLDCYADFPFFTKGLCKCMYLSAWDDEHFCILLEILTDMSLGRETNTREMRVKGEARSSTTRNIMYTSFPTHFLTMRLIIFLKEQRSRRRSGISFPAPCRRPS